MASFFYADIKTDELQIHGHNPSIPAQIELLDANASNMVIIKAPLSLTQPNVIITLPSNVSNINSLMMNTSGTGSLELIAPSGDLSMANYGTFTVNGISNTATIISSANINLASGKQLNLGTANIGYDGNTNMILSGSNQVITRLGGQQVFSVSYTNGNALINMGSVTGESGIGFKNTSVGQIQVKPNSGSSWSNIVTHLPNLGDVQISGLANNNALLYNSAIGKWFNSQFDGALGYYGSFFDTSTQTNAGLTAANAMRFNTTAEAHGVSIVNNSNITVSHAGVYNIQFSAQLENLSSGTQDVNIWLSKNGINESNTDTKVTLVGKNAKNVASWNFVLTLNANDYVILYWSCTDSTQVQLTAEGTAINPTRPAIPSVILTVTRVINIQDSTLRMGDLLNVNDTAKTGNSIIQFNSGINQYEAVSNLSINTGNLIKFGTTANISTPVTGNLTILGSNIDLIVPNGNEVHVHNNLRVTGTLYMDGNNNSNISAPTASNLDLNAGNINITGTKIISCNGNLSVSGNITKNGNVIVTGPSFSVYAGTGVSCASGSVSKMTLDTEEFDTHSCFNNTGSPVTLNGLSVPSYSFMPNIPGYYQINGHVSVASFVGTTPGIIICNIYKNGGEFKRGSRSIVFGTAGQGISSVVSSVIYFNGTTDYIDLRFLQGSGSTETTEAGSVYGPYLNGCFLRGP